MSNPVVDSLFRQIPQQPKRPTPKQIRDSDPWQEPDPIHGPVKQDTPFDVPLDSPRTDLYAFLKDLRKP